MKSRREERRQKVLDDLLELDPVARRPRLDLAVAAGEVHQNEVESTLRLVARLDALRVFTIRPVGGPPDPATPSNEWPDLVQGKVTAQLAIAAHAGGAASPKPPRRKPVAVPVGHDSEQARRRRSSAAMPIDALEAASRVVAHERAVNKAGAAPLPSRRGRGRAATVASTAGPIAEPRRILGEPAPESSREESWPSISWLRP